MMRKDGRFTQIPQNIIDSIREAKEIHGDSLAVIASKYGVSKTTVSLYCRDLFDNNRRKYSTEEEARKAIILRNRGKDHSAYRYCYDCGKLIRNEYFRCLGCEQDRRSLNGQWEELILAGIPTRFSESRQPRQA